MPRFETPQPITMTVEIGVGDVRVNVSDRADTVVEVRPTREGKASDVAAAESTLVEFEDGRLHVHTPKSWKRFTPFDAGGSVDVIVDAPTGSTLEGDTGLGDLHGEGELGDCRFKTGMGNTRLDQARSVTLKTGKGRVVVDRATGDCDVSTGSGDVRVREIVGTSVIKNSNGATHIGEVGGDLRVKAANGDISIDRALGSVVAKTANGDVQIGEVVRGVIVLESSAGELSCGIADETAVWLDVRSSFGRVRSTLDPSEAPKPTDQTVEVRARTAVGDITIHRASEARAR